MPCERERIFKMLDVFSILDPPNEGSSLLVEQSESNAGIFQSIHKHNGVSSLSVGSVHRVYITGYMKRLTYFSTRQSNLISIFSFSSVILR